MRLDSCLSSFGVDLSADCLERRVQMEMVDLICSGKSRLEPIPSKDSLMLWILWNARVGVGLLEAEEGKRIDERTLVGTGN